MGGEDLRRRLVGIDAVAQRQLRHASTVLAAEVIGNGTVVVRRMRECL